MRVGLVCPYSLDVYGGVQNHVLGLADALMSLGHDVSVLAPGDADLDRAPHLDTVGRSIGLPFNGSVAQIRPGSRGVRAWLDAGEFDVVHLHEPAVPSVTLSVLSALVDDPEVTVVATFHTAQSRAWALRAAARTNLRRPLARIDAHIAVSAEAQRTLSLYQQVTAEVIPNGIDVAAYEGPHTDPADGGAASEEPDPTLVFVGRADEPRKGLAVLLRAMPEILRAHPRARLVLVGSGAGQGEVGRLVRGLGDRIEVLGPVDDAEKVRRLAQASILVAPNTLGESFGIVLTEAMAAAAPVLASDLPGFSAVLDGGSLGRLFRTGDPADLAAQAVSLLDDPAAAHEVALRARRAAYATFDWSVVAPRVVEVYRGASVRVPGGGGRNLVS